MVYEIGLSGFPAGGEDFQAHIAAGLGPFIVLLGQHRADQADDGLAAREDPDHDGPPADLFPFTTSRRFSVGAGFYRTCVIDGLMQL
jgi:hypothetical protein